MLEITLTICLAMHPRLCRDVTHIYDVEAPAFENCIPLSAPEVARWGRANPEWFIKRWSCQRASTVAKI